MKSAFHQYMHIFYIIVMRNSKDNLKETNGWVEFGVAAAVPAHQPKLPCSLTSALVTVYVTKIRAEGRERRVMKSPSMQNVAGCQKWGCPCSHLAHSFPRSVLCPAGGSPVCPRAQQLHGSPAAGLVCLPSCLFSTHHFLFCPVLILIFLAHFLMFLPTRASNLFPV